MTSEIKKERQELFNRAYLHIIKQGKPSFAVALDGRKSCQYKSPDGCGCAAEPFITSYTPSMEGESFTQLAEKFQNCIDTAAYRNWQFVRCIQMAHDDPVNLGHISPADFISEFKQRMQKIANDYSLTVPE